MSLPFHLSKKIIRILELTFGICSIGLIVVLWPDASSARDHVQEQSPTVKSLHEYHKEFAASNTSITEQETLQILLAKGIPFEFNPKLYSENSQIQPEQTFQLRFKNNGNLSEPEFNELKLRLSSVLSSHFSGTVFSEEEITIELNSSNILIMQMSTNVFSVLKSEEELTDFSESLHFLGSLNIRGLQIFIDGTPLGAIMQQKDRFNDLEMLRICGTKCQQTHNAR